MRRAVRDGLLGRSGGLRELEAHDHFVETLTENFILLGRRFFVIGGFTGFKGFT
jgi:hypothetical protein